MGEGKRHRQEPQGGVGSDCRVSACHAAQHILTHSSPHNRSAVWPNIQGMPPHSGMVREQGVCVCVCVGRKKKMFV